MVGCRNAAGPGHIVGCGAGGAGGATGRHCAIGDAGQDLRTAKTVHEATFDFAIQTHGSIGPSCAVAQFDGGQVTCWTASQSVHTLRHQLAATLGVSAEKVRCIYVAGAGCYGRNGHEDAAADAVLLPALSANRRVCSGCGPTSMAGTRKVPQR
jgi:CO/xanthine dehydrogenase Mo-binding subunit